MKYYVYILQSLKIKRFYIGVTSDIEKRIGEHNSGSSSSTKPYRPWKMIYFKEYDNKQKAYKKEYYLKHQPGFLDKKKIIAKYKINIDYN